MFANNVDPQETEHTQNDLLHGKDDRIICPCIQLYINFLLQATEGNFQPL